MYPTPQEAARFQGKSLTVYLTSGIKLTGRMEDLYEWGFLLIDADGRECTTLWHAVASIVPQFQEI